MDRYPMATATMRVRRLRMRCTESYLRVSKRSAVRASSLTAGPQVNAVGAGPWGLKQQKTSTAHIRITVTHQKRPLNA